MRSFIFALALLLPLVCRAADQDTWDKYNNIKDNSDFFVGEGIAKMDEFQGDADKALEAAKERAREDLGRAVKVEVKSKTQEKMETGPKGTSEEIKSEGQSASQVSLENVKTREFRDFPSKGKITALAYLSKEDYRRQQAGKSVAVYRPENGFRVSLEWEFLDCLDTLYEKHSFHIQPVGWQDQSSNSSPSASDSNGFGALLEPSLDFVWNNFTAGFSLGVDSPRIDEADIYDPAAVNPGVTYFNSDLIMTLHFRIKLGYDWTPLNWKIQPFIPLRLEYGYLQVAHGGGTNQGQNSMMVDFRDDTYAAGLFGGSAGLGLRYWANDSIALEAVAVIHQGFNSPVLTDADGHALQLAQPDSQGKPQNVEQAAVSLTGHEYRVGLLWSGF